jgi:hypothetical protein
MVFGNDSDSSNAGQTIAHQKSSSARVSLCSFLCQLAYKVFNGAVLCNKVPHAYS